MTARTPARRPGAIDRADYLREVESFTAELAEMRLAAAAGGSESVERRGAYERHPRLFDRHAIDALAAELAERHDPEARALHAFAVEGWLERQLVALTDRIERSEAQAVVVWRGERLEYRRLPARIAEIGDRVERNALHGAFEEAVEAINPLREERMHRLQALVLELGYADYADCIAQVRGIDLTGLGAELRLFVTESETVYYAALRRYLAQIEIEQGDATLADATHLFRARSWDAWFPAGEAMAAARTTLAGLGVELDRQENVTLELLRAEKRDGGRTATAVGVRVPSDLRLVARPTPGYRAWSELLHAVGHLEHLAHAEAPLAATVDPGLAEAWGFLLDALLLEPAWVSERTRLDEATAIAFSDFASFRRLYGLRLQAAKLLYELRLHRTGDLRLARAYYGGLLSHLTGVIHPPARYLADAQEGFDSAAYLRGWMAAATIADGLRARFGPGWWRSREAGRWLVEAWGGRRVANVEDAVAQLGYDRVDWRPVLRQIRTHLVGEMSGYGGPNITTRAGTRKV